jgi:tetratricopeptide (TPR) repeat protein
LPLNPPNKETIEMNPRRHKFSRLFSVLVWVGAAMLIGTGWARADAVDDAIGELQHAWAKAYYQLPEKQKEVAFKELSAKAHQVTVANPGRVEPMIWEAIILSSYAKFAGGFGALGMAKEARDLLLQAEKEKPDALNGSVYTSLGSLYYKVPGWPIGFGDSKKARAYLEKAIKLNPDGIDANFFYGDFLQGRGEYAKAAEFLQKAVNAPARPGREDADRGRRAEALQLLEDVKKHG